MGGSAVDKSKVSPAFWRIFENFGIKTSDILRLAKIPQHYIHSQDVLFSTDEMFRCWKAVETLATAPAVGIEIARAMASTILPPIFVAAQHSRNFQDAIAGLVEFKRRHMAVFYERTELDGTLQMSISLPFATEPTPAVVIDLAFGAIVEMGRLGTGHDIRPVRVELARPGRAAKAHEDFFGAPIRYDAPCDLLVLSTDDTRRTFCSHNPELLEVLVPAIHAAHEIPRVQRSIKAQVKSAIRLRLPRGRPSVTEIAADLNTHERTLQRRIRHDGTSFRALLSEARQEAIRNLVSKGDFQIDEVPTLLGYSDTSSFYRAFRNWEGITPAVWRRCEAVIGDAPTGN
ncbi:MAG TPA: AraC family transcriptional regulator ligand-binding domain-containing protein [Rhizobium sp.]